MKQQCESSKVASRMAASLAMLGCSRVLKMNPIAENACAAMGEWLRVSPAIPSHRLMNAEFRLAVARRLGEQCKSTGGCQVWKPNKNATLLRQKNHSMVIHKHNAIRDHLKDYAETCHIPAHIQQSLAHLRAADPEDADAADAVAPACGQRRTETANLHIMPARMNE
eukprot:5748468-Amphidinium_carterae.1